MSLSPSTLLTVEKPTTRYSEDVKSQARNPIYNKLICVGCIHCHKTKKGRVKNFKTLWCLYQHLNHHHSNEVGNKDLVMELAELIIKGVLL